ncbi:MAG: hypothetical protein ACK56Q_05640, partial [Pirellulaceae bacterium]
QILPLVLFHRRYVGYERPKFLKEFQPRGKSLAAPSQPDGWFSRRETFPGFRVVTKRKGRCFRACQPSSRPPSNDNACQFQSG